MEEVNKPKKGTLRLKREFEIYRLWWCLPGILRGRPIEATANDPGLAKFGITDPELQELLQIKTQTAFAEKYGIKDLNTLSEWNKKLEEDRSIDDLFGWAKKLTPNVLIGLYKAAVNDGKAAEFRAWMEVVEKIQPGLTLNIPGADSKLDKLAEIIGGVTKERESSE